MVSKDLLMEKFSRFDFRGATLLTPFVVCKNRRTLYLHIAKTGGSTVTSMLRKHGLDDHVLTNKRLKFREKVKYFSDVAEHWDEYLKFTFVRNKFAQLVSLWHYNKKILGVDFPTFIRDVVVPSEDVYGWWIDQYYLTVLGGQFLFDLIGHTESFSRDMKKVCSRLRIKGKITSRNVGSYDKRIPVANYYDEELKRLVCGKFRQEVDHFRFSV